MEPTHITYLFSVFALFGLIWTVQLVHYPMFQLIEAPHWPRFHRIHSRNITFIVFPLMLMELLTALQMFLTQDNFSNSLALGLALTSWVLTIVIFVPLHNQVATRPIPEKLSALTRLNWLRTLTWTFAAANAFTNVISVK